MIWMASILSSVLPLAAGAVVWFLVNAVTGNAGLGMMLAIVPAIFVAVLLALLYPVVLTSGRVDLQRSAAMSKGARPQLLAIIFLASIATFFVAFFVISLGLGIVAIFLGEEAMTGFANAAASMIVVPIQVLVAGVNIVVVSFAFRWIDYYSPDPLLKDQQ